MSHRLLLCRACVALGSLGFAGVLALGAATPASAHDALQSSDPAADATVTEPLDAVTLTYSEELLALGGETNGFAIQVIDVEDQSHHEDGCVAIDGATASEAVALDPGTYQVLWQVVSSDGHPISGEYRFDYAPATTTETAEVQTVTTAPACGDEWAGSAPAPTETDAEGDGSGATATQTQAPDADQAGTETGTETGTEQTDDTASDVDIPLGVIVIGGLGILAAAALVIALAMRRMKDQP